jgi:hypothetical protein
MSQSKTCSISILLILAEVSRPSYLHQRIPVSGVAARGRRKHCQGKFPFIGA